MKIVERTNKTYATGTDFIERGLIERILQQLGSNNEGTIRVKRVLSDDTNVRKGDEPHSIIIDF